MYVSNGTCDYDKITHFNTIKEQLTSVASYHLCITKASVVLVQVHVVLPNCFKSMQLEIADAIHLFHIMVSKTVPKAGASEIGHRSFSVDVGGCFLGSWTTASADFPRKCHATVLMCLFWLRPIFFLTCPGTCPTSPVQAEIGDCFQGHSLGCARGAGGSPVLGRPLPSGREGVPLRFQPPSQTLTMDASNHGWGAILDGRSCTGSWTQEESHYYVNLLEALAVLRALQFFQRSHQPGILLVQTDNTTIISYLNQMGGTRSQSLNQLAQEISFFHASSCSPNWSKLKPTVPSSVGSSGQPGQVSGVTGVFYRPGSCQPALSCVCVCVGGGGGEFKG